MKSFSFRGSVLFCIIAVGWPMAVPAQFGWYWQNPLPQGNHLWAVSVLDSDTFTAVGDLGTIVRTTDGGDTWTPQTSGTTDILRAVSFVDANTGTVVGGAQGISRSSGTILRTTDGGATWIRQTSGTSNRLYGVSFVDADNGTAVGEFGTMLRTTTGEVNLP